MSSWIKRKLVPGHMSRQVPTRFWGSVGELEGSADAELEEEDATSLER
jgi:hypothetical protein